MSFTITTRNGQAGDKTGEVYELVDTAGTIRAEVWPFCGFNCLRWQTRLADGTWGGIFYTAPDWETNPVPTRSGHPILFPFPGRLRDGRLVVGDRVYQLPLNESSGKHAIHGFTPRNPWRVVGTNSTPDFAEITGEFQLSKDLPESLPLWPADFVLRVTYRLRAESLSVIVTIENPTRDVLPCGLGYHPYFTIPGGAGEKVDSLLLRTTAEGVWEATDGIPTGTVQPVNADLDFRERSAIGATHLDHVFTRLGLGPIANHEMMTVAELTAADRPGRLSVEVSPWFRELVLFTPPHRQAVAIEPYTCSADAATLAAKGVDSGWDALAPGERRQETVIYHWSAGE